MRDRIDRIAREIARDTMIIIKEAADYIASTEHLYYDPYKVKKSLVTRITEILENWR